MFKPQYHPPEGVVMEPNTLARNNHLFFYVSLTQRCLLTKEFNALRSRAARIARYAKDHPGDASDDEITQMPFQCSDGEFGYLKFTNDDAQLFEEKGIETLSIAMKIPMSIQGEVNDRCEVLLNDGVKVSFKIVGYEGNLGHGCVGIKNPVTECPEQVPLGRMVEMSIDSP
jgi:hypothetical protein